MCIICWTRQDPAETQGKDARRDASRVNPSPAADLRAVSIDSLHSASAQTPTAWFTPDVSRAFTCGRCVARADADPLIEGAADDVSSATITHPPTHPPNNPYPTPSRCALETKRTQPVAHRPRTGLSLPRPRCISPSKSCCLLHCRVAVSQGVPAQIKGCCRPGHVTEYPCASQFMLHSCASTNKSIGTGSQHTLDVIGY